MHTGAARFLLLSSSLILSHAIPQNFFEERMDILAREASQRVGGHLELTPEEVKVNTILMHEKRRETESALINGSLFPPAVNFMQSKLAYEESKVFKIIRKMPKGAALHLHEMQAIPLEWVVKNVTYRPDCYMCSDDQGTLLFRFFRDTPKSSKNHYDCQWERVSKARQESMDKRAFDQRIFQSMSLNIPNSASGYVNNREAWRKFNKTIITIEGLTSFSDVVKDRLYETLRHVQDDNVMYVELRGLFPAYDLDGDTCDREWVVEAFIETVAEFQKEYPDFLGAKYIINGPRTSTNVEMKALVNETMHLRFKYPDVVAGLDISIDEDRGRPNVDFVDEFLYPSTLCPSVDLPYFFHAGETDWIGTRVDADILDAILLGTKRIGHGFAIHGHPELLRLVKEKNIAIEVNPISNQVLALVHDLRVHPAVSLLAQNYPIVISSDDPSSYDSLPASYDYYATFMALGGAEADLRFLKQLIINSFMYSAMKEGEKNQALDLWKRKWDIFITDAIRTEWARYDSIN